MQSRQTQRQLWGLIGKRITSRFSSRHCWLKSEIKGSGGNSWIWSQHWRQSQAWIALGERRKEILGVAVPRSLINVLLDQQWEQLEAQLREEQRIDQAIGQWTMVSCLQHLSFWMCQRKLENKPKTIMYLTIGCLYYTSVKGWKLFPNPFGNYIVKHEFGFSLILAYIANLQMLVIQSFSSDGIAG